MILFNPDFLKSINYIYGLDIVSLAEHPKRCKEIWRAKIPAGDHPDKRALLVLTFDATNVS